MSSSDGLGEVLLLVIASIILFVLTLNLKEEPTPSNLFEVMSVYSIVFIAIVAIIYLSNQKLSVKSIPIFIIISFVIRYPLLELRPVASTDLNRNLMFGHLIQAGHDPYQITGSDILNLISSGDLDLIVPYTSAWDFRSYDYPSFAILLFTIIILLYRPEFGDPFFFAKLTLTAFDILTALVIFQLIRNQTKWGESFAVRAAILYLINPISVFQVSLEGQFEGVVVFFTTVAIYYTLAAKNIMEQHGSSTQSGYFAFLSGVFLAFGFLTKYYPLILLPLFLLFLWRLHLVSQQILGFLVTTFFCSIPFIFTGSYITNFLEFQALRQDTVGLSFEVNTLGYQIGLNILGMIVFLGTATISFLKQHRQGVLLGLIGFFLSFFVLTGNSLFPWYLIMIYPTASLVRLEGIEFTNAFAWGFIILFYQIIWYPDPSHISAVVMILLGGFGLAIVLLIRKEQPDPMKNRILIDISDSGIFYSIYKWLHSHPHLLTILLLFSITGLVAPFTGLEHDTNVWISVARERIDGINPYVTGLNTPEYYAYPPPWMLVLELFFRLGNLLPYTFNEFTARFFIKLPLIIATAVLGLVADIYLKDTGIEYESRVHAFVIIVLNPFIITISAIWGMFDVLPALFTVLAILFCNRANEHDSLGIYAALTGISIAIAALFKLYPAILIPVLFLSLNNFRKQIVYLVSLFTTICIIVLPFYFLNTKAFLYIFDFHSTRMGGGITYWNGFWILIARGEITFMSARNTINLISYVITIFSLGLIYLLTLVKKFNHDPLIPSLLTALLFFATFKLVLEQYVVWLLPLVIIWSYRSESGNPGMIKFMVIIGFTLIPLLYLTVSVPITDLFYLEFIRQKGVVLKEMPFLQKQVILFILGILFSLLCLLTSIMVWKSRGR